MAAGNPRATADNPRATAGNPRATILRARVLHTPRDPFSDESALDCHENGAVAFQDGEILATGDFAWSVTLGVYKMEFIESI